MLGFGYCVKFIVGFVVVLGEAGDVVGFFLDEFLRAFCDEMLYVDVYVVLMMFLGIGFKVFVCVCLFFLNKYEVILVDMYVW